MSTLNEPRATSAYLPGHDSPYSLLLPDPVSKAMFGPATRRRLIRTAAVFTLLWGTGAALLIFGDGRLQAFGLGLWLPGAGFLSSWSWWGLALFVASLALFAFAFLIWFAMGAIIAPIGAWVVPTFVAGFMASPDAGRAAVAQVLIPCLMLAFMANNIISARRRFTIRRARGIEFNEHLATVDPGISVGRNDPPRMPELSAEDLALQRYLLELSLQPVDSFEGFSLAEQWQLGSVRYQMVSVSTALSLSQYVRTPAFHGYLSQAQQNMINKFTQPVVWRYWFYENLLGNLAWDADPIARDNIMLSGFMLRTLGYYTSATGDDTFSKPGSLTFHWSDSRSFAYDHHKIYDSVVRNFGRYDDYNHFPCEPNLIFPICNLNAMAGVRAHDRAYGSHEFERLLPKYRSALEKDFSEPDGSIHWVRATRFGFNVWKSWSPKAPRGGTATFLNGVLPDVARREYELLVKEHGDERLQLPYKRSLRMSDFPGLNDGMPLAKPGSGGAREMGDDALADAYLEAAARMNPTLDNGVLRYPLPTNVLVLLAPRELYEARIGRKGAHYDIINVGLPESWATGPVLQEAEYPQVLVASAYTDGHALDLVLRPGDEGGRRRLGVKRLVPGARYRLDGAVLPDVTADPDGFARFDVDLTDRLEVRLAPVA